MVKKIPIKSPGEALSTFFRAPWDPKGEKIGILILKKKAQTLPKQLPNNFEKVQKTTFLTTKIVQNDP